LIDRRSEASSKNPDKIKLCLSFNSLFQSIMKTQPLTDPIALELPAFPRSALDELYHYLQYLQFKYKVNLESALETIEDEIDGFDAEVALQEPGSISLASLKQELGLE
jgi:hypothetical protein